MRVGSSTKGNCEILKKKKHNKTKPNYFFFSFSSFFFFYIINVKFSPQEKIPLNFTNHPSFPTFLALPAASLFIRKRKCSIKLMGRNCEIGGQMREHWEALAKVGLVIYTTAVKPAASRIGDLIDTI